MAIAKEYTLKLSTEQAQANVDELNKSLELQENLIEDIETELGQYQKQLEKTSKRDLAARKSINDKIKETKTRLNEEKSGLKKVTKERKKANESMKEAEKNAADYSGVLGMIDSKTGGLISGMKGMTSSVGGATKGFNLMKVAIIGTGIGALLIGILAVSKAFTSSEEGQNKFAKIMGVIGSVVGNLVDMLANLGEGIISVFENPKQAIIDLKNLIVENITNRITSLIDTFGFLGSAIKKVFSGDFSGAMDDAKAAGSSYIDTMTGVKDTINKVSGAVKELVTEIVKEGKIAGKIADQRAKADKLDRKLIVERAEANRKRAELLEKAANKEKFTAQERIEFLTEAGRIEEEITAKEIKSAKLRYDAKVAENKLSKSTKEDKEEEAQLQAKLIDLETARLAKAKAVTAQIVMNMREEAAEKKAIADQAILDKEAADLLLDEKDKALKELKTSIRDAEAVSEDERRALEIIKVTEHYDKLIALATLNGLSTVDLLKAKAKAVAGISKATAKNEIVWAELTQDEKVRIVSKGFSDLSQILGEETAAGKAAAIASATISTYQSAISSYNSLAGIPIIGPALGFAAAGAAVASGIGTVKKIMSTKVPGGGSTSGGMGGSISAVASSAPSIPSAPPEFNVVGASDTNQLAGAIGNQAQTPVQAYVVSNDVSTAQELDRNIISGASLG